MGAGTDAGYSVLQRNVDAAGAVLCDRHLRADALQRCDHPRVGRLRLFSAVRADDRQLRRRCADECFARGVIVGVVGNLQHVAVHMLHASHLSVHALRHEIVTDQVALDVSDHSPVVVEFEFDANNKEKL